MWRDLKDNWLGVRQRKNAMRAKNETCEKRSFSQTQLSGVVIVSCCVRLCEDRSTTILRAF